MGLGIWLGHYNFWSWPLWSILSGIFIMAGILRNKFSILALYLAILCLGALSYQNIYLWPSDNIGFLTFKEHKRVRAVEGTIESDVYSRPTTFGIKQTFEFQVDRININDQWRKTAGKILVNFYGSASLTTGGSTGSPLGQPMELRYGDHLILEGTLFKAFHSPLDRFSYQQYLEDHSLWFILSVGKKRMVQILSRDGGRWAIAVAIKIRHRFKSVLATYLEPQETSMIQAMALGDRSFLTKDMYALFSKTGTSHILAISGMNMALISTMVLFILKVLRVARAGQFILTTIFLFAYALLAGWTASVVRSVLMAAVFLSSFCLEFDVDTANSLGLAALVLFLLNPLNLFDIGFQLSFICVTIIIHLHPLVQPTIQHIKARVLKYLLYAMCVSLVAWVGITGIIAYEYDIVSPVAVIANIFVVPLADLVIALSLGLVVIGLFCPPLAAAFAGALKVVFNFTLLLTSWFAQVPGGYFYIHHVKPWHVCVYYLILIMAMIFWSRKNRDLTPRQVHLVPSSSIKALGARQGQPGSQKIRVK